jgi:hypothetical protein
MNPAIAGALISGAFGLFSQRRAEKTAKKAASKVTPAKNIVSQFDGVVAAAKKHGFNPLTVAQLGNPSGSAAAGAFAPPPLTSNELLMSSLNDMADIVSGETARRNAANDLELDLARIKIDQLTSGGGLVARPPAFNSPEGSSNAPASSNNSFRLGRNTSDFHNPRGLSYLGNLVRDEARSDQVTPALNDGGVSYVDNPTLGGAFPVPTFNGELLDVWQLPVVVGSYIFDRSSRLGSWLGTTAHRLENGLPIKRPRAFNAPPPRPER